MKTVTLDGKKMTTQAIAHVYLQNRLELPAHYGHNLDALWDILSTRSEPVNIRLIHCPAMLRNLGGFAGALLKLMGDVCRENPRISFEVCRHAPRLIGRLPEL